MRMSRSRSKVGTGGPGIFCREAGAEGKEFKIPMFCEGTVPVGRCDLQESGCKSMVAINCNKEG